MMSRFYQLLDQSATLHQVSPARRTRPNAITPPTRAHHAEMRKHGRATRQTAKFSSGTASVGGEVDLLLKLRILNSHADCLCCSHTPSGHGCTARTGTVGALFGATSRDSGALRGAGEGRTISEQTVVQVVTALVIDGHPQGIQHAMSTMNGSAEVTTGLRNLVRPAREQSHNPHQSHRLRVLSGEVVARNDLFWGRFLFQQVAKPSDDRPSALGRGYIIRVRSMEPNHACRMRAQALQTTPPCAKADPQTARAQQAASLRPEALHRATAMGAQTHAADHGEGGKGGQ